MGLPDVSGPETYRAEQRMRRVILGHERKARISRHALTQAIRGFGEAPRPKAQINQSLDAQGVGLLFVPDGPHSAPIACGDDLFHLAEPRLSKPQVANFTFC